MRKSSENVTCKQVAIWQVDGSVLMCGWISWCAGVLLQVETGRSSRVGGDSSFICRGGARLLAFLVLAQRRVSAYVATISIRHLTKFISHLDTRFSIQNFERSVCGCVDGDFRDQLFVRMMKLHWKHTGKVVTYLYEDKLESSWRDLFASTNSAFFLRP